MPHGRPDASAAPVGLTSVVAPTRVGGAGSSWTAPGNAREPGRTGLRGGLAAPDRRNLIRVMPAKGGAHRHVRDHAHVTRHR